ncbi:hypothetical protein QFZ80_007081 [Paenibacillus sp. V4I7]|nr:hypothetical protein [Paenibacillus sp. V4I7]MDQ0918271.1 hypothetical protein [Paenibacillus sp. V4I5]
MNAYYAGFSGEKRKLMLTTSVFLAKNSKEAHPCLEQSKIL